MTWFRVDDGFPGHPKLEPLLSDPLGWTRALSVWLACGCYAARYNTDGRVTPLRVTRECADGVDVGAAFADLVLCELLEERDGAFWMHDFLQYNPTKTEVEKKREANRERQKRFRSKARNAEGNGVSNALRNEARNALPTRPVPTQPDPTLDTLSPASGDPACPDCDHPRSEHLEHRCWECLRCSCGHGADENTWSQVGVSWQDWAADMKKRRLRLTGKTQLELAKALMVGTRQVSQYERGLVAPEPQVVKRWLKTLHRWESNKAALKALEPPSDQTLFVKWFSERWSTLHDGAVFNWNGKTFGQLVPLLKKHGHKEVQRRAEHMFSSIGSWNVKSKNDVTIGKLVSGFNGFASAPNRAPARKTGSGQPSSEAAIRADQKRHGL